MSSAATLTQGTKLQRGDGGAPEIFTAIPEIMSISGPDSSKSEIKATDLDSTAEEFLGGLADFGRMTVELYYRGTLSLHAALRTDFANPITPVRNWRLLFVDGKRWDFAASVFSFPMNIQPNDTVKVSMVLRLTGPVVEV